MSVPESSQPAGGAAVVVKVGGLRLLTDLAFGAASWPGAGSRR
jgi:hypothetical protein